MEKVILVDIETGYHDFPCSSSGFEPRKAMFQFSLGIPFFSVLLSRQYEYCLKFSLFASHEAFFLSSVKDNTDYFCNVLRLCFI